MVGCTQFTQHTRASSAHAIAIDRSMPHRLVVVSIAVRACCCPISAASTGRSGSSLRGAGLRLLDEAGGGWTACSASGGGRREMVGGLLHGGGWLLLILMMMMRVPVIISEDLWHNVRQYANERERGD